MNASIAGDIKIVDASENIIEAKDIRIGEIIELIDKNLSEEELRNTFCLQFIDPWGDTIFNQVQTGILIKEFGSLIERCRTEEEKEKLQSIIEFISKAEKDYLFVRFYGD